MNRLETRILGNFDREPQKIRLLHNHLTDFVTTLNQQHRFLPHLATIQCLDIVISASPSMLLID